MKSHRTGLLMAALTAVSWSFLSIGLKYLVNFLDSESIVWVRMLVAFLGLLTYCLFFDSKSLKILFRPPVLALVAALCLAFNYLGFMKGIELTTASNAQIMIQMGPLLLAAIGVFHFKEKLSQSQKMGFLVALTGFGFFFWDQLQQAILHFDTLILGNSWIFMAAITWAAYASFQKVLIPRFGATPLNLITYGTSSLALLPGAIFQKPAQSAEILSESPTSAVTPFSGLEQLSFYHWLLLILLGLNTIVAYGALSEALKRIPASLTSIVITLNPILTIITIQWLTLGLEVSWLSPEPIEWRGVFGACAVIFGVILAVRKPPPPPFHPEKLKLG